MVSPERKHLEWSALLFVSLVGAGISLWGYQQIINLPAPTSLDIKRVPKIIFIFSPENKAAIASPVSISGKIKDPEKTFRIRIKDYNNKILKDDFLVPKTSSLGLFNISLNYKEPTQSNGIIQFYEYLPEDDLEINHRSIPVSFSDFQ
ncbi:MAG: hypothetical protein UT31_C0005G0010 [Parcubacteria group bacterium GW2011_GWF2_39_13b]|nr:MAG: hypothetical protein UT31_C0005G0010 [Parcubacteria group bacterium GW2011_GWF2_39_13b]